MDWQNRALRGWSSHDSMEHLLNPERLIRYLWWAATLLLAFSMPFEFVTPWLNVSSILVFTNVELVTLTALLLWIVYQISVRQFPTWQSPLTLPIGLLLCILLLASFLAPTENLHALKVTARWFIGAAVFWMIVNAAVSGLPVGWLIRAMVLGAVIVAAATWGEALFKETVQPWLAAFRIGQEFQVGGELRPSGTLAFPTITAMYLESGFFLAATWLGLEWSRRRWFAASILALMLLLSASALVLTLTRSALAAVGLAAVVVIAIRYHCTRLDLWSRITAAGVGVGALILVTFALVNPTQQLRLLTQSDTNWYRARFEVLSTPSLYAGETATTKVRVQNSGLVNWESTGDKRIKLFYHWLSADGQQQIEPDGARTELPHDVAPGETVELLAQIRAPSAPGEYVIAWDMLREGAFWFSALGAPTHLDALTVAPPRNGNPADPIAPQEPPPSPALRYLEVDRLTLWRAAGQMVAAHPLFGVGPGNFRLVLGAYLDQPVSDNLHANNTYLELFADAGIAGGIAFLFFTFAVMRLGWRGLRMTANKSADTLAPARSFWLAGVVAALAAFFIHSVTDYFLEFTPGYLLFWSLLAYVVAFTTDRGEQVKRIA